MRVLLRSEVDVSPSLGIESLREIAAELLTLAGEKESELSILLVDDERIRSLNAAYRGKDKPTNVLSFPMRDDEAGQPGPDLLGDIVISVDTALREAADREIPPLDHFTVLCVHGLVHLLGFDHEKDEDEAREMAAMEEKLLAGIVGDGKLTALSGGHRKPHPASATKKTAG